MSTPICGGAALGRGFTLDLRQPRKDQSAPGELPVAPAARYSYFSAISMPSGASGGAADVSVDGDGKPLTIDRIGDEIVLGIVHGHRGVGRQPPTSSPASEAATWKTRPEATSKTVPPQPERRRLW